MVNLQKIGVSIVVVLIAMFMVTVLAYDQLSFVNINLLGNNLTNVSYINGVNISNLSVEVVNLQLSNASLYSEVSLVNDSLWSLKMNDSDQRYNETLEVLSLQSSNATIFVLLSGISTNISNVNSTLLARINSLETSNGTIFLILDDLALNITNLNTSILNNVSVLEGLISELQASNDSLDARIIYLESINTNTTIFDCPTGNYSYGRYANGTLKCRDYLQGTSGGSSANANLSFNPLIGITSATYDGDMSGYEQANKNCADEFTNTHLCLEAEVLKAISVNSTLNTTTGTYWMSKGAPGYTAEANDCSGWTTNSDSSLGAFWNFDLSGVGQGKLTTCAQVKSLLCCGGTV